MTVWELGSEWRGVAGRQGGASQWTGVIGFRLPSITTTTRCCVLAHVDMGHCFYWMCGCYGSAALGAAGQYKHPSSWAAVTS